MPDRLVRERLQGDEILTPNFLIGGCNGYDATSKAVSVRPLSLIDTAVLQQPEGLLSSRPIPKKTVRFISTVALAASGILEFRHGTPLPETALANTAGFVALSRIVARWPGNSRQFQVDTAFARIRKQGQINLSLPADDIGTDFGEYMVLKRNFNLSLGAEYARSSIPYGYEVACTAPAHKILDKAKGISGLECNYSENTGRVGGSINPGRMLVGMLSHLKTPNLKDQLLIGGLPALLDMDLAGRRLRAIHNVSTYIDDPSEYTFKLEEESARLLDGSLSLAGTFLGVRMLELYDKVDRCNSQLPDPELDVMLKQLRNPSELMSWEQIQDGMYVFQQF